MKNTVDFEQGKKKYTLCFTSAGMAKIEQLTGCSFQYFYACSLADKMKLMNISFTATCLQYGLQDIDQQDPFDIIDEFCEAGGTIDILNGRIIEALGVTGFFVKMAAKK